jgi:hypothetical protein
MVGLAQFFLWCSAPCDVHSGKSFRPDSASFKLLKALFESNKRLFKDLQSIFST